MKTLTTQITILIFLFLFPSTSFSQTFKCEFVSEKFRGGKSNEGACSGDPEIVLSSKVNPSPRTKHCDVMDNHNFNDLLDFNVDLDKKMITYSYKSGMTEYGVDDMVSYKKRKGNIDEKKVREQYSKLLEFDSRYIVSSVQQFTQRLNDRYTGEKTTNYLITFTRTDQYGNEEVNTLFIPKNEKSILSSYDIISKPDKGSGSWINMKFGRCVNTSN
jgi:hypothetical protein